MNQFSWNGSFPSQDLRFIQSKFVVQIYVMILGWYQLVPNPICVSGYFYGPEIFKEKNLLSNPEKKVILCFIFPLGICKKVLTLILFKNWILFSLNASFCFVRTIVFSKKKFPTRRDFLWFFDEDCKFCQVQSSKCTNFIYRYTNVVCTAHLTLYNAQFIYCKLYFWIWTLYNLHLQRTSILYTAQCTWLLNKKKRF